MTDLNCFSFSVLEIYDEQILEKKFNFHIHYLHVITSVGGGLVRFSFYWRQKLTDIHNTVFILYTTKKTNTTRGPWATSLTWENSSKSINTNDYIIMLIKRRKNNIIYFMRIFCFFIWRILNPPHQMMLCAKIGWNWLSGSGEENFLISSMCLHYFVIISPWKRAGPFNWTNMNPLHPRMLCAKFGWNWPSGSGEEDF